MANDKPQNTEELAAYLNQFQNWTQQNQQGGPETRIGEFDIPRIKTTRDKTGQSLIYGGKQYIFGSPGEFHQYSKTSEFLGLPYGEGVIATEAESKLPLGQVSDLPGADELLRIGKEMQARQRGGEGVSVPTGGAGFGIPSMEQVRAGLQPAGGPPPLISRVGERARLREEYGLEATEQQLTDLKAEEEAEIAYLREQRTAERAKPVPMGVIEGRIGEIERQAQERLDYIGRQKSRLTNELNMKYTLIGQYVQDLGLDYQDAVSRYDSELRQNLEFYDIIREERREVTRRAERAEDIRMEETRRAQDISRANLQIMTNAITSGNLPISAISGDQKIQIAKLEAQAGLPVGFIGSLRMNPGDRILTINNDTGEALVIGANGEFEVKKTGMTPTPGKTTQAAITREEKRVATEDRSKIVTYLENQENKYGHVAPETWNKARTAWQQDGYDLSDFNKQFVNYTDPNRGDYESAYGLKRTGKAWWQEETYEELRGD